MPVIKTLLIGAGQTGKTMLANYCVAPSAMPNLDPSAYKKTIGVDVGHIRDIGPAGDDSIAIWDLMGYTEQYANQLLVAWPNARLIFLCIDITNSASFTWAEQWLANRPATLPADTQIYLVATKQDQAFCQEVTTQQLAELQATYALTVTYQTDATDEASLKSFRANVIRIAELILNPSSAEDLQKNQQCRDYLASMLTELEQTIIPHKEAKKQEAEANNNDGLFNKKAGDFNREILGLKALLQALQALAINHRTFSQDINSTIDTISTGEHQQAFVKNGVAFGLSSFRKKSMAQYFCERLRAGAATCVVDAAAPTAAKDVVAPAASSRAGDCRIQ